VTPLTVPVRRLAAASFHAVRDRRPWGSAPL